MEHPARFRSRYAKMAIYRIDFVSRGMRLAADWFDDDAFLWSDRRLASTQPLRPAWTPPWLRVLDPQGRPTPVLFNPQALAVSTPIREALGCFPEIEFLPVEIRGGGPYHIFHLTRAYDLPRGAVAQQSGLSVPRDLGEIRAFPADFQPDAAFFRIRQPTGSPGGQAGDTVPDCYASDAGAAAIDEVAHGYLAAVRVSLGN